VNVWSVVTYLYKLKTTDMDFFKIITFTLIAWVIHTDAHAQTRTGDQTRMEGQPLKHSPVHIGLIYPISTNGVQAPAYSNSFSLHAFGGVSGVETGVALAGFSLVIMDSSSGLQASGFANYFHHNAGGTQLAGFMNIIRDTAAGVRAAGFMNATGVSKGVSMAGFINISWDAGTQIGGFMNVAGDARTQIGGFMNIARKVKGVQIAGFINIADSSDYPIGIVNIIRNGEKSMSLTTDETLTSLVTLRSGSRKLYGIFGVGYNGKDKKDLYAWEAGLGAHFNIVPHLRLNTELVSIGLTDFKSGDYFRGSFRLLPALRLGHRVEFFAGPTFNYIRSEKGKGAGLVTHYVWSEKEASGVLHGLYFGATGGMNIFF